MRNIIIGVIIVVVLGGGAYAISQKDSSKEDKPTSSTQPTDSSQDEKSEASESNSGSPLNVTVTANDNTASPDTINAAKGQTVNLTFKITNEGTYYGGMQFKSTDPSLDTGTIPGGGTKTITFTADKSFKFTPYWPQSSVQKDYFVTVNVK